MSQIRSALSVPPTSVAQFGIQKDTRSRKAGETHGRSKYRAKDSRDLIGGGLGTLAGGVHQGNPVN